MISDLPGDIGPLDPAVDELFRTLTSEPTPAELAGEQSALAMFRANITPPASPAFSDGSRLYVMPRIAGHIIAPPMPIRKREASSTAAFGAKPPSMEKPAKMAAPAMKMRRRPNMSARRPPVTMSTPKTMA